MRDIGHLPRRLRLYRIALFSAAAFVAVACHFGAILVWGADSFCLVLRRRV
jgi:hypothetical protein